MIFNISSHPPLFLLIQSENHSVVRILALQEVHFFEKCHHFVTLRDIVSDRLLGLDPHEVVLFKSLADLYVSQIHPDSLEAHRAWLFFERWRAQPSKLDYLHCALLSAARISDLPVKNGLLHWIWATEVSPKSAGVMFLIEKMGKCPKERPLEKAISLDCMPPPPFLFFRLSL